MQLAFVLLEQPAPLTPEPIAAAWPRFAPEGPPLLTESGKAEILSFNLGGGDSVHITEVDIAISSGEVEEAAQFSISSLGTGWQLRPHRAHLIVAMVGQSKRSPVESLTLFTRVLAAVTQGTNAVGVYWGNAGATHAPDLFCELVQEQQMLPLWTGLSIAHPAPDRLSLLSLGMSQLELPDLLLEVPRSLGNEALGFFFDLLGYVADRGEAIPAGETVGRNEAERLPVSYVPSPIDPQKQVWRVDVP